MAGKTNNTACAIVIQSAVGTFNEPTLPTDLMPISQLRPSFTSITGSNDEYTGSIVNNADSVAGSRKSFSFNVKIRPPGTTLPGANQFLLGRLMQALKFSEVRVSTAIPPAAQALGTSTTTTAVLGAAAGSVDDQYNGYPLLLASNGTGYKRQLTQIMDYIGSSKTAALPETLGSAASGNYQIPPFLGYFRSVDSSAPPVLSMQFWLDGIGYDLRDVRPTSATLVFPTSGDQVAYPELQVTVEGILVDYYDEATPSIPALGAIPLFKDGDMWLNRKAIGGSSFSINLNLQTENPPNPNQPDGYDAPEITASTAVITQTRQRYTKAVLDTLALANAQTAVPFWAQYGSGGGNMVQVAAPAVRLAHPSPDMGGGLINESGDLLVDANDRGIALVFPMPIV